MNTESVYRTFFCQQKGILFHVPVNVLNDGIVVVVDVDVVVIIIHFLSLSFFIRRISTIINIITSIIS